MFAKAWLEINGNRITGEAISAYHKEHNTSSYHCLCCGGPIWGGWDGTTFYPCPHCGYGGDGCECDGQVLAKKRPVP